jgi:hypothetical protein
MPKLVAEIVLFKDLVDQIKVASHQRRRSNLEAEEASLKVLHSWLQNGDDCSIILWKCNPSDGTQCSGSVDYNHVLLLRD